MKQNILTLAVIALFVLVAPSVVLSQTVCQASATVDLTEPEVREIMDQSAFTLLASEKPVTVPDGATTSSALLHAEGEDGVARIAKLDCSGSCR